MDDMGSGRALKSVAAIHGDYADEFGVKNVRIAAQDNTSTTCSNVRFIFLTFKNENPIFSVLHELLVRFFRLIFYVGWFSFSKV